MNSQPLTALDHAFLSLEREATPMHIGGVAVFRPEHEVDIERIGRMLRRRARRVPLLRRRLELPGWSPLSQARWIDQPTLDASGHVQLHQLPAPGGREDFADLVSRLSGQALDLDRPLWKLHVIGGADDGRFAVMLQLHHALADGSGAVKLALNLLDPLPRHRRRTATVPPMREPEAAGWPIPRDPRQLTETVLTTTTAAVRQGREVVELASSVFANARWPFTESPLAAPDSPSRRVAMLQLPLNDVRDVRSRFGGTTNDVLLATTAGAIRHWLSTRGRNVDQDEVQALIPVSRRARNRGQLAGNHLSGYRCGLPISEPTALGRLRAVQETMARNKATGTHRGPGALPLLAGLIPSQAHRYLTPTAGRFSSVLFDTVVTTVPVPSLPLTLAHAPLQEIYPLAPVASGHALSVGFAQYDNRVHIGLHCSRTAVPDLEKLMEAFPQALHELVDLI